MSLNKIKKMRKKCGLTQKELADAIGVTQKDVSRWETGVYNPKVDKLLLIAEALSCDLKDLL
jgi:transcriptional regulator with XRE-family HTH domain